MGLYTFQLEFRAGNPEKGEIPFAGCQIALKTWTHDDDDTPIVSAQCAGEEELEHEVRRLQGELDEILKAGRRRFRDHRTKVRGLPA